MCKRTKTSSADAKENECGRDEGYNSRRNRYGKHYTTLCCTCAVQSGFDLTIADYGGCCRQCLARNIVELETHQNLHLDTLCAKLSSNFASSVVR